MNSERVFLGCGVLLLAAVVWWHLTHAAPPRNGALGIDPSVSVERNCGGLRTGLTAFLKTKVGIREGSTLNLLVMGTDARNPNPKLLWSEPVPVRPDVVFGVDEEEQKRKEDQFYDRVEQACEGAKGGSGSPVFALVQQGIAHLRSLGCLAEAPCYYLVKTDLDDDVHPALRTLLQRAAKSPDITVPRELAHSIDNAGVEITFCGVSEVTARRTSGAAIETRERIWRELFTVPALVTFQPYCK